MFGYGTDIEFHEGRIYSTAGQVIDPEAKVRLGVFSGIPTGGSPEGNSTLVAPDVKAGRVFFLIERDARSRTLLAYDPHTFLLLGSRVIPGVSGRPSNLIRWGADGLAFRTSANQLFLIRTSLAGDPLRPRNRIALFRRSTREWLVRADSGVTASIPFGRRGQGDDVPVPARFASRFGLPLFAN